MIDTRAEFESLFWSLLAPVTIAVFAAIVLLLAYTAVRGRRRPSRAAPSHAPWLEALYAGGVAVIVAAILGFSFAAESRVDRLSQTPGVRIDVTAFQWQWRFAYPGTDVVLVGSAERQARLVVPTETTIRFTLVARDVVHSFWIPELRFKRDAFPKRATEFDLVFPEAGIFAGRCAEFCGLEHAHMTFDVVAVPPSKFRARLAEEAARR